MELNENITETIKNILEDLKNEDMIGEIGEFAVVEKMGNIVRLRYTCNESDQEYDTIEEYDDIGWYFPIDKLTSENFWNVWGGWNGYVSGGIYLDDDYTQTQWTNFIDECETIPFEQLKTAKDGIYAIAV